MAPAEEEDLGWERRLTSPTKLWVGNLRHGVSIVVVKTYLEEVAELKGIVEFNIRRQQPFDCLFLGFENHLQVVSFTTRLKA